MPNGPYVHPRLDSILKIVLDFPYDGLTLTHNTQPQFLSDLHAGFQWLTCILPLPHGYFYIMTSLSIFRQHWAILKHFLKKIKKKLSIFLYIFENIMENGAFAPLHPHKVLSVLSKVRVHLLG